MRVGLLGLGVMWMMSVSLRAESGTTPPLGVAFPLAEADESGAVRVLFPVAISPTAIVGPEAILRVIYVQPQANDLVTAQARQRTNTENSYSRPMSTEAKQKLTAEQEAAKKIVNDVVWPVPTNFRLALENLAGDKRLVYFLPGETNVRQESFHFPQGLFMGEKDGGVTVLAVENDSPGAKAGFVAGDRILLIKDTPVTGLAQILELERSAREAAQNAGATGVAWQVRDAGGTEVVRTMRLPPTLKGSLFDLPRK